MRFLTSGTGMGAYQLRTHESGNLDADDLIAWAADNGAYSSGFKPSKFFPWLESLSPYKEKCLFVVVPDSVGNAIETLELWREWVWHFDGWPVAFAAQDGQENLPLPNYYDALFVGGTTEWKMSEAAESVIRRAQNDKKHIHIGRVNWFKRYKHFRMMKGSENWTCDGTRQRFDGRKKTMEAWNEYMEWEPLIQF